MATQLTHEQLEGIKRLLEHGLTPVDITALYGSDAHLDHVTLTRIHTAAKDLRHIRGQESGPLP